MKKFTKLLSMMLVTVLAISVFTINSSAAMSAAGQAHQRELTADEISAIYPMFNAEQYVKMYPDVKNVLGEDPAVLFDHFIHYGIWEQRQPSVAFNVDCYASFNSDLQEAFGDDIVAYYVHYATCNKSEGWRPTPTPSYAYWHSSTVYSVYDFVQGQKGPKSGAVPVLTLNYHPGFE